MSQRFSFACILLLLGLFLLKGCLIGPGRECNASNTCDEGYTCHNNFCINQATLEAINDAGSQE